MLQLEYHPSHISWVEGDAQELKFKDNTFDAYTIAFGIRNVVNIDQVNHIVLIIQFVYILLKCKNRYFNVFIEVVLPDTLSCRQYGKHTES